MELAQKIGYTESINQPTKIRLANGEEVAITDWEWRNLYSTIDTLSGFSDNRIPAFSYSLGQQVKCTSNIGANQRRTATLKDTNLDAGESKMPAEQEYICYAIAIYMEQLVFNSQNSGEAAYGVGSAGLPIPRAANVAIAINRLSASLEVTQKDFFQNKLGWFGAGGGVFAVSNTAGAARTYGSNGLPTKDAIDTAPVPVHIGGTEAYSVLFVNDDGGTVSWVDEAAASDANAVIRFTTSLVGLHKRPTG